MKVVLHSLKNIEWIIKLESQKKENNFILKTLYDLNPIARGFDFSIVKDNILGDIVGGTSKCSFLLSKHEQVKYKLVKLHCSLLISGEYQFKLILTKKHLVQEINQDDYYTDSEKIFKYKDSLENSILSLIKNLNEYCNGDFIFELDIHSECDISNTRSFCIEPINLTQNFNNLKNKKD